MEHPEEPADAADDVGDEKAKIDANTGKRIITLCHGDKVWLHKAATEDIPSKLAKCFYCGDPAPDHFGRDCAKMLRDRCWYCGMENPDHLGRHCPDHPVKGQKKQRVK